jgi:hypothetical protein
MIAREINILAKVGSLALYLLELHLEPLLGHLQVLDRGGLLCLFFVIIVPTASRGPGC